MDATLRVSKFRRARFLIFSLVFVSRKLAQPQLRRVNCQSPYGGYSVPSTVML